LKFIVQVTKHNNVILKTKSATLKEVYHVIKIIKKNSILVVLEMLRYM